MEQRLIDANKLHYKRIDIIHDYDLSKSDVVVFAKEIDKAPIIDAVPIVRCKDCVSLERKNGYCICDYLNAAVLENWFCWAGERKKDDSFSCSHENDEVSE